jgi:hypothetical protein
MRRKISPQLHGYENGNYVVNASYCVLPPRTGMRCAVLMKTPARDQAGLPFLASLSFRWWGPARMEKQ